MSTFEKIFSALGGRKFIAFLTGTGLCIAGLISAEIWFATMTVYCASNVVQKIMYEKGLAATAQVKE